MARRSFEDSAKDKKEDRAGAKKAGMSAKAWEKSPKDKAMDRKGQAEMDRKRK